jgi:hypothetical protein
VTKDDRIDWDKAECYNKNTIGISRLVNKYEADQSHQFPEPVKEYLTITCYSPFLINFQFEGFDVRNFHDDRYRYHVIFTFNLIH